MGEPTEAPPPAESGAEAIPRLASQPSPVQLARGAYVSHARTCPKCRDIDRNRCEAGQELWRGWERVCDEAYRQLAKRAP